MVKNKSEDVQELTATSPFPEGKFAFEHTYYDFSILQKTTDRFYENKIIGLQRGVFGESAYSIKYDRLNGKVYHSKSGNDIWGLVLTLVTLLISIIGGFFFGFGTNFGILPSMNIVYILFALGALFLISWPIKFVKREIVGLYGESGNIAYWAYINKTNKEKVEKIIEFIQSKIPSTNDELLKEQA